MAGGGTSSLSVKASIATESQLFFWELLICANINTKAHIIITL